MSGSGDLDPAEQEIVTARIQELGERASPVAPFVHLFLEPTRRAPGREPEMASPAVTRKVSG